MDKAVHNLRITGSKKVPNVRGANEKTVNNVKTVIWSVDKHVNEKDLAAAAECLRKNEVVAFPTETVYGLGANALSDEAVGKIFEAKGRPSDNPLIVHISDEKQLENLVEYVPETAKRLMEAFWPGPLTLIYPRGRAVSDIVTGGLSTVAVRMPNHPTAIALIRQTGLPLAAPSANRSGRPSPTTAEHVKHDLDGRIAGIVDGGGTGVGLESTVVDCSGGIVTILRPGGVTKAELERVIGSVSVDQGLKNHEDQPKSPGMKYTHYAPKAAVTLVDGGRDFLQSLVNSERKKGKNVGVLTTEESSHSYNADVVVTCGRRSDLSTVARGLYAALRKFDEHDVDVIFAETFPAEGVGEAVMNRLEKSAGGRIIRDSN